MELTKEEKQSIIEALKTDSGRLRGIVGLVYEDRARAEAQRQADLVERLAARLYAEWTEVVEEKTTRRVYK